MSADPILQLKRQQEETAPTAFFAQDGRYRLDCPDYGISLEVDFLRRESHQLKAEVAARCDLPGARTTDGVLAVSDLNLSSTRTRAEFARYLAERSRAADPDWVGLVEELAQRVLTAERTGKPAVVLGTLPKPAADQTLEVDGLTLPARHPSMIFGDGGTAKSYLLLHVLGRLAERGHTCALFDWELDGEEHRDRLERLFGPKMPPVLYARCTRPLVYEVDRLRRLVRDEGIDFAGLDSVAFACDGPPEAAEVAGRYFQALRQLGPIGSAHVAHVTKAFEGADQKPFGSVFWHNGARSAWNVKLAQDSPGAISIALHHRKANLGPIRPSVGFELRFEPDRTLVKSVNVGDVPDLAAGLSIRQRMAHVLNRGALDPVVLAAEVEADVETVRRTARRYKSQFSILDGGRLGLSKVVPL